MGTYKDYSNLVVPAGVKDVLKFATDMLGSPAALPDWSDYYWKIEAGANWEWSEIMCLSPYGNGKCCLYHVPAGTVEDILDDLSKERSQGQGNLASLIKEYSRYDSWKKNGDFYVMAEFSDVWDELSGILGEETGYNGPDRPYWDTEEGRISITHDDIDGEEVTIIRGLDPALLRQVPDFKDLSWDPHNPR